MAKWLICGLLSHNERQPIHDPAQKNVPRILWRLHDLWIIYLFIKNLFCMIRAIKTFTKFHQKFKKEMIHSSMYVLIQIEVQFFTSFYKNKISEKMLGRTYTKPLVCKNHRNKIHNFSWIVYMFPFLYFLCFLASLAVASGK